MLHRQAPLPGYRPLRCLKRPSELTRLDACIEIILDDGTYLFPLADIDRGASISAARLRNAVLRLEASFPYDQPFFARFGLSPAWLADLVHNGNLILSWSEGREDAAFDERMERLMGHSLYEEAGELTRRVILVARSAGLAPLMGLTSEDRRSLSGLYETAKVLCRTMRSPTLWKALTVGGLTEEDRAAMDRVRLQLRDACKEVYARDARAQWLSQPLTIGKAIVMTELSDVALLAQAGLPPERREVYQVGTLLDRSAPAREEKPETPAGPTQPTGSSPAPGSTPRPAPQPTAPAASPTAPTTTPTTTPATRPAPPAGTTPAAPPGGDPSTIGVVFPDGTTHWLPQPGRPAAAPATTAAPVPATPAPAATPAAGTAAQPPPDKPKGRRPGRRRGPISAPRPRGK